MIIWLASYPRSGNTLLRTVMYQCFGKTSYSDEIDPSVRERVALAEQVEDSFGHRDIEEPWHDFYEKASVSSEIVLVKTHRIPRDRQKAIYVVRDGRQALVSYRNFHRRFLADRRLSLLQLVLGMDFYGGWSEHYDKWVENRPETLAVRFEDLVSGNPETIESLYEHLDADGSAKVWKNPFEKFQQENPTFFCQGKLKWDGDPIWSDYIDTVFFLLHGRLMTMLEYSDPESVQRAIEKLSGEARDTIRIAESLNIHNRELAGICDERMGVINSLKKACDERLDLINRLSLNKFFGGAS